MQKRFLRLLLIAFYLRCFQRKTSNVEPLTDETRFVIASWASTLPHYEAFLLILLCFIEVAFSQSES